jgi:hypothetical protein
LVFYNRLGGLDPSLGAWAYVLVISKPSSLENIVADALDTITMPQAVFEPATVALAEHVKLILAIFVMVQKEWEESGPAIELVVCKLTFNNLYLPLIILWVTIDHDLPTNTIFLAFIIELSKTNYNVLIDRNELFLVELVDLLWTSVFVDWSS